MLSYFKSWAAVAIETIPLQIISLKNMICEFLPECKFESDLKQLHQLANHTTNALQYLQRCHKAWQDIMDLLIAHTKRP